MWKVIDTGVASAQENMRLDQMLLQSLSEEMILHFYDWEQDSATYGYFVKPEDFLDLEEVEKKGLAIAKRPTGGGIVFHKWDFAFSVLVPSSSPFFSLNTLENYNFVNRAVLRAAEEYLGKNVELIFEDAVSLDIPSTRFCMARPTKYDVVLQGKKIAGAAQRKVKEGFLHQGMISLELPPEEYLEEILLPGTKVLEAIRNFTYPILGKETGEKKRSEAKESLRHLLQKHLMENT